MVVNDGTYYFVIYLRHQISKMVGYIIYLLFY